MKNFQEFQQELTEAKSINLASAFKQVLLKFDVENAYKDKKSISSPKGTELGKAISWIKTNYKKDAADLVAMIIDKKYRDDVLRAGEGQRNLKKLSRGVSESIDEARADYKRSRTGQYNTKVTVCYISPITRMRACDDLWFKSKLDALGFKDDVRGFPKGAEVEAIKVMKESVELDEASSNFKARKAFNDKISKAKKGQCDGIMKDLKKAFDKGEINASDYDELTASCGRKMDQLGESTIQEKLSVSDGVDAWISDFHKSDAPQFKGKSKEERTKMAIAAFKSAEGTNEETGTSAVAGAGDDSSTVVVKKKKRRTLDDVLTR
jgi:hypothetical protein